MPPLQQRLIALRVLDVVTVAVWRFGEAYAKRKGTDGDADDEGMGPVSPSQRRSNRSR